MLEVIGAGDPEYKGKDWADVWANSQEKQQRTEEIQNMISERRKASEGLKATKDEREYAMPLSSQVRTVVHRSFTSYWRSPEYLQGNSPKCTLHFEDHMKADGGRPLRQIHPARLHRPLQRLLLLGRGQLLHRHAVAALQRFHDPDHRAPAHPAAAATLPRLQEHLPVQGVRLQDLFVGRLRHRCGAGRVALFRARGHRLLVLLVLAAR